MEMYNNATNDIAQLHIHGVQLLQENTTTHTWGTALTGEHNYTYMGYSSYRRIQLHIQVSSSYRRAKLLC